MQLKGGENETQEKWEMRKEIRQKLEREQGSGKEKEGRKGWRQEGNRATKRQKIREDRAC